MTDTLEKLDAAITIIRLGTEPCFAQTELVETIQSARAEILALRAREEKLRTALGMWHNAHQVSVGFTGSGAVSIKSCDCPRCRTMREALKESENA